MLLCLALLLVSSQQICNAETKPNKSGRDVWLVYFYSSDCPQCEAVGMLLDAVRDTYKVKIKKLNVEKENVHSLFRRLESIHGNCKFSVPLVLIDDEILVGPDEIESKLENIVQARLGKGAELPYLGRIESTSKKKGSPVQTGLREEPRKEDCPP